MKFGIFAFLAVQSSAPAFAQQVTCTDNSNSDYEITVDLEDGQVKAATTNPVPNTPGAPMKFILLSALSLLSLNAFACPDFSEASRYTEVAVPCHGTTPDFSQPVAVNQSGPNGGECRVTTTSTEYFLVNGTQLYWCKGQQVMPVGTLLTAPSCYQTDADGEYYATWNPVSLAPAL